MQHSDSQGVLADVQVGWAHFLMVACLKEMLHLL